VNVTAPFGVPFSAVTFEATSTDVPAGTVTVVGVGSTTRTDSGSHSDIMVGWYVSGGINYALSDSVGLFAGVQYQDMGVYKQTESRKQAQLELGGNIFLSLGITFSF